DRYAPCRVGGLVGKGYDYWALGKVQRGEEVPRDPVILCPGTLQGRHARETGPKGATLVTVGDGGHVAMQHRVLDVVRWEVIEVDVSPAASADDVVELVRERTGEAVAAVEDRVLAMRL